MIKTENTCLSPQTNRTLIRITKPTDTHHEITRTKTTYTGRSQGYQSPGRTKVCVTATLKVGYLYLSNAIN